jgi:hypothetical protein
MVDHWQQVEQVEPRLCSGVAHGVSLPVNA